jgi:hypothetical protein
MPITMAGHHTPPRMMIVGDMFILRYAMPDQRDKDSSEGGCSIARVAGLDDVLTAPVEPSESACSEGSTVSPPTSPPEWLAQFDRVIAVPVPLYRLSEPLTYWCRAGSQWWLCTSIMRLRPMDEHEIAQARLLRPQQPPRLREWQWAQRHLGISGPDSDGPVEGGQADKDKPPSTRPILDGGDQ